LKKYLFVLLILACAVHAAAYTRITASTGLMPKWPSLPIPYWINERGYSGIANGSEFTAVHAAFQTWQNIPEAAIQFQYMGTTPARSVGHDGINLVTFDDDITPVGSSAIAVTFSFFRTQGGSLFYDESDIVFSQAFPFSTSAEPNKFDIQSVLTHEIGHVLGLDHSALVSSVMVPFAAAGQLDMRSLAYDDIAGVVEIYPRTSALPPPVGQIRGTLQAGPTPVFGAHIVALDADGTVVVGALTQPDGSYVLRYLPPGAYRVLAEPLDLPVTSQNISASFYRNVKIDFGTTYFPGGATLAEAQPVSVTAGSIAIADFQTLPANLTGLNLTRPGAGTRIVRGSSGTLNLGGEDLTAGTVFSTSSPGLVLGQPTYGGRTAPNASSSATMSLSVAPSTPLGPKDIAVNRGGAASVISGGIVVVEPSPSNVSVSPGFGLAEGGTNVTIRGANFRPGAGVFFGGLAAVNIQLVDSATILATTPANSPNAVNVVVINSDGTWGTASQGFTYSSAAPTISRISPTEGPPGTSVTIEGDHFDPRTQNIEVRFNGILARIINSTASTITAVAPFGTTSGPVTVTVYGQTVTGPSFTVTSPAVSSNLATAGYNFIDATGGTRLSLSNPDDSVGFVSLPFSFGLFRETYIAGARISVATNGYVSLDGDSSAEFQNSSLPAQTVARATGAIAAVPPALLAAFWDDLYLQDGSDIYVDTVGTAPNRKFVVEWTNMTVLDENGTDLRSHLTFELVLFEGSNDIQFLYQNLSGPRSDGSSATVGMQDSKRSTGFLTAFNQAVISSGSFFSYRFLNGSYAAVATDTTPPSTPLVIDGGAKTQRITELSAAWIADDPESGIRNYEYAIGKTPGATDVRPFTSTIQASVTVTGLSLEAGATYYFSVKATNNGGFTSDVGGSDGIKVDPTFQPDVRVIVPAPQGINEFSGIALYAPAAMSVVLKVIDGEGNLVSGVGIRNPMTVTLTAGQQYSRLMSELFGNQRFDGWIEAEASAPGAGIYTTSGSLDGKSMDGAVARPPSPDFWLFHAGASAFLVNPSTRIATVNMNGQSLTIGARSRLAVTVPGIVRVQSSEALAVIERTSSPGKLALNSAVSTAEGQPILVFPYALTGSGYSSVLSVANVLSMAQDVTVTLGSASGTLHLEGNATARVVIGELLHLPSTTLTTGALRVSAGAGLFGGAGPALVGVLDIESSNGLVTVGTRPAATSIVFPHVAHGNGLFTGLALAAGARAASVTIDVYDSAGGTPRSTTVSLQANQQQARLISEFIPAINVQMGGYIRVTSDQPIWAWEIYGSGELMASSPPL
jgi:matrixin/IPT/TIG domain-containing protein